MPEVLRKPQKLASRGIGLRYPPDLTPEGLYPALTNMVSRTNGTIEPRREVTLLNPYPDPVHSMRRLNDPAIPQSVLIAGSGQKLFRDAVECDPGFSGLPLAMVPLRPAQSPSPWMYVMDGKQSRKIRASGLPACYEVGIAPPVQPPVARRVPPNFYPLTTADPVGPFTNASPPPWHSRGTASANASFSRINTTISAIIYDAFTSGWCSIIPATFDTNIQVGALAILSTDTTNPILIREVHPAVTATTISKILYDTGASGPCSIVPANGELLEANSVVQIGAELVRIRSVTVGPDGQKSFRTVTANPHVDGEAITGVDSFRTSTVLPHIATETIKANAYIFNVASAAPPNIGWLYLNFDGSFGADGSPIDLSALGGRTVSPEDFIHISLALSGTFTRLRVYLNIDATFPSGTTVTNALVKEFDPATVQLPWTELLFKISDMERIGTGAMRSLQTVTGLIVEVSASSPSAVSMSSWWIGGTYAPSSFGALGYTYYYRYRSSLTGAYSNPSPPTRTPLGLLREAANLVPIASLDDQVDTIDLFRFKNLSSGENALPRRVVSIPNSAAALGGNDLISDAAAEVNETLDFEHFQPFPVSDLPHSGTCEVSGVLVHRLSGDPFNIHWQAGSQVLINGVAYTLFAPPIDTDTLELTESAGAFNSTSFSVPEATLGGQSMPCLWGPDPLTGVVFACGHPLMGGTLSWTRPYDPDGASDADTLEITSPSEPLMNGFMYDGRSYVYTTERLFLLYAQRITDPNGNPRLQYAAQEVPNHKGLSCRYASAVGDLFWAVNKDGVYQQSEAITTEGLHPLFPHQGEVGVETNGYKPIDFTKPNEIRLFFTKGALYLLYKDTDNVRQMMVYDRKLSQPGWFPRTFQVIPLCVYEEEGQVPPLPTSPPRTLLGAGGPIVPDTPIAFDFITRAEDMADPRLQKLFLDHMIDLDPKQGITITPHILFNNLTVDLPFAPAVIAGLRQQIPISQLPGTDLSLYRNAALKLISQYDPNTHTPPVFYEYEPNAVLQPYLARVMSSPNFITLGFTTYGHLRDSYWCWISTSPITVVIKAKDLDNEYTYTFPIPSSSGKVRKQYFPLKALKGLVFYFSADAASPFALFTEETIVRAKEWGSNAAFISAKPFQGQSR